jgi:hypothetical protein
VKQLDRRPLADSPDIEVFTMQRGYGQWSVAAGSEYAKIGEGETFTVEMDSDAYFPADCQPVDTAINALYAANNTVQAAINWDVCYDRDVDSRYVGDHLALDVDRAAYGDIRDKLSAAYAATNSTDRALEKVQTAFCDAVSER